MRRPKATADGSPRIAESIATSSTAIVLTFTPPAVEPDAPPMNIRARPITRLSSSSPPTPTESIPPLRRLIE
jgi:hypothetical protein